MRELTYIKQFNSQYPAIELWFMKNVMESTDKKHWECSHFYETVGLVIVDLKQGKLCHLSTHPNYRGRGIGKFLYSQAMKEFMTEGIKEIFCHGMPEITEAFKRQIDKDWTEQTDLGNFGRVNENKDVLLTKRIII
jgi:ribosomal protein S18 acetylase RimI-like enzyme